METAVDFNEGECAFHLAPYNQLLILHSRIQLPQQHGSSRDYTESASHIPSAKKVEK